MKHKTFEELEREEKILDNLMTITLMICAILATMVIIIAAICILFDVPKKETSPVQSTAYVEIAPEEIRYHEIPLSEEVQDYVFTTSDFYGVPSDLIFAIIQCESGYQADVISSTHDYGLMQINVINLERLQRELGITDILDPYQNILCGIHLLAEHYFNSDEDIQIALLKYNCGVSGAKSLMDKGIYSTYYTEKILAAYEQFKEGEI